MNYFSFNCDRTPKIPKVGAHNPTKTPTCRADAAFSYPGMFRKSSTAINIERIIKRYKPKIILDNSLSHNNSYFCNVFFSETKK